MRLRMGSIAFAFVAAGQISNHANIAKLELDQSANPHLRLHGRIVYESPWVQYNPLPVCWENPDGQSSANLQLVRQSVTDTWQCSSGLNFTGWQKCAKKNHGIRLFIADVGPRTLKIGQFGDGVVRNVTLNFMFSTWSQNCQATRDACIRSTAVHEFGQAIGFVHEQNSPNAPGECRKKAQGALGDKDLTPYDPTSVMNYCNRVINNNGHLSALDRDAVQTMYGNLRQ